MPTAVARVSTSKPSPYLKQFCKHFSHHVDENFTIEFGDESGELKFTSPEHGVEHLLLDASAPDVLVLKAYGDSEAGLEDLESWAGEHLVRFGRRDELVVDWVSD